MAVMGPLTNLALAMRAEPRLADWLGPVVVMGGARAEGGNITPSAEFNIWADPDAAAEVFGSGCEMVVFGLDATHQVRATEARIAAIERTNKLASAIEGRAPAFPLDRADTSDLSDRPKAIDGALEEMLDDVGRLTRSIDELLSLERYERRALSPRKRAIRRFDALGE